MIIPVGFANIPVSLSLPVVRNAVHGFRWLVIANIQADETLFCYHAPQSLPVIVYLGLLCIAPHG